MLQVRSSLTFRQLGSVIYSKTWMWHDKKNSQLKNFLPLYTVLLIYSKVKASQTPHGGTNPVVPSKNWIQAIYSSDQKNISCFHIYSVVKNRYYLTVSQYIFLRLLNKYSRPQHLSLSRHL